MKPAKLQLAAANSSHQEANYALNIQTLRLLVAHGEQYGKDSTSVEQSQGGQDIAPAALKQNGDRAQLSARGCGARASGGRRLASGHPAPVRLTDGEAPVAQPGSAPQPEPPVAEVARSNRAGGPSTSLQRREAVSLNTGGVVQGLPGTKTEPALVRRMLGKHQGVDSGDAPSPDEANTKRVGRQLLSYPYVASDRSLRARNGFDVEGSASSIVLAGLVRHEQPANVNRERQLGTRSRPRGVNGVDAQGVRVTHLRKHTSKASGILLPVVEIMQVVEAPSPAQRLSSLKTDYARERDDSVRLADQGSIPCGSTTSTDEQVTKVSAQLQGSAGRPASVSDCLTGSAAAQPAPTAFYLRLNTERLALAVGPQATPPRGALVIGRVA